MGLKKLKNENIVQIYRSGKKKVSKTRNIIVQFENKPLRDSFYEARKKLHDATDSHRKIYINDDLTEFRMKLLYDARTLVKKKKRKGSWSQHGNVMVLKDNGRPKPVYNYNELQAASGTGIYIGCKSNISDEEDYGTISDYSY